MDALTRPGPGGRRPKPIRQASYLQTLQENRKFSGYWHPDRIPDHTLRHCPGLICLLHAVVFSVNQLVNGPEIEP
jgi:hypothetical protein